MSNKKNKKKKKKKKKKNFIIKFFLFDIIINWKEFHANLIY